MKKINVFRSMMVVIVFTILSSFMSGCFYSYGHHGGLFGYRRPYYRTAPAPPPPRYQAPHHRDYGRSYHRRNDGRNYSRRGW